MGKVLITGAAGFIGSNLLSNLSEANHEVLGIDNLARPGVAHNLKHLPQKVIQGDIRDSKLFEELPKDIDIVFHLAASADKPISSIDARQDFEINAAGTLNVLEFCRKTETKIIYASSSKVYSEYLNQYLCLKRKKDRVHPSNERPLTISPDLPPDLKSNSPVKSRSPYGCSKFVGEIYCQEYFATYNVPFVINRLSCIYGPRQFGNSKQGWLTWLLIAKILEQRFTIFGDGYQVRDMLYIDDLNELLTRQWQKMDSIGGNTYVIGGGLQNSLSVIEAIKLVDQKIPGKNLKVTYKPRRLSDHQYFIADTNKAGIDLLWKPNTAIQTGLAKTVNWIQKEHQSLMRLI
ncbi:MAG: NAD-dependent epimerase/dehydratase family protein [Cyanobacteria bacterium P01_H01_bin.105]